MTEQTARKPGGSQLTGKQKAAVILLAMGPEAAAEVTRNMSPAELEEISYEIARIDRVPGEVVDSVIGEWNELQSASRSITNGGVDFAREVLETALGSQKAASVVRRIESQLNENAGFRNLRQADSVQLAGLLRNEHPQSIALLLAHLDPDQTAALLKELPAELGGEVLLRLARLEKVLPEVLQLLERSYGAESSVTISTDMFVAGGPGAVAAVLNRVTRSVEKQLLDDLGTRDAELCDNIRNLMFVFEDIIRLDDRALQRLLREVQTKELALALKAASEPLKQRLISLMSGRAADALREEIEFLGPVRLRDVEAAQAEVVRTVRALEEAGELVISGSDDELVL